MLRSLYSGVSAIKVNQVKLDVIANNIANVGTTAFKSSRVRFKDMISQSVTESAAPGTNQGGVNLKQVGQGVQISGIDTMVGQGMMQPTSRNLDVAMDGEGYLMVGKGAIPTTNAAGVTLDTTTSAVTPDEKMGLYYTRDGALTLDKSGNLLNSDGLRVLGYTFGNLTYTSGVAKLSYVDANAALTPEAKLVPLVIPDTITDGSVEVKIKSFSIEKDGQIKAVLDNGKITVLGQIATVSFKNPAGLAKVGGNLYGSTSNAGEAIVRTAEDSTLADNTQGYGDMLQGMLEMSNVDLAEQFTDMIITTRAFQAAGKTITTGDEILQEIINLKR
ncbi:flagellar hook-basal body complex protein [Clostridium sp.]|uniref:flagellar hook-basal body complex protein n=1 Tax=Clostridium sp. TaxID=1506 RepID=UPI003D6D525B